MNKILQFEQDNTSFNQPSITIYYSFVYQLMQRQSAQPKMVWVPVCDLEEWDCKNFDKACNDVCYYANNDLEIYFSIVDIGFILRDYAMIALKVKKNVNVFELGITKRIKTSGTLLPLQELPVFLKIQRFSDKEKVIAKDKRIKIIFDDGENWKIILKNRKLFNNWVDLLKLAASSQYKVFRKDLLVKELKRNYEAIQWHIQNPFSRSNLFESVLEVTPSFKEEMQKTKQRVGTNSDELIGRLICENKEKRAIQEKLERTLREGRIYQDTIIEIERSVSR